MSDRTPKVLEQYDSNGNGLIERIKAALGQLTADGQPVTVSLLAPADHFHSRGILATEDLANAVGLTASMHVLDLGCGIGGPARYFAATSGCKVVGVDLSPSFIEAARILTDLCGLQDRVIFKTGNALQIPFEAGSFDAVFLHHVAMNIEDRDALYAEVHRVLKQKGQFATHDIVLRDGDLVYPTPWAVDSSTSFLLREDETQTALGRTGFEVKSWSDDTAASLEWFKSVVAMQPTNSFGLSAVMGPEFSGKVRNLAQNIGEHRVGVLSAVCMRD